MTTTKPLVVIIPPCTVDDFAAVIRALCVTWPNATVGPTPAGERGFWVYLRGEPPEPDPARLPIHPTSPLAAAAATDDDWNF